MSADLVHVGNGAPEIDASEVGVKPYMPDTEGFKQLLKSHDHLCFEY